MNKIISLVAGLIMAVTTMAQQPVITYEKTTHDFGKINEADGRVTTVFAFKNEGATPLVLSNVRASCGCTTPKWTKEPIAPGEQGNITVTYNPNGRPGRFQKTITVTSNATEATTKLYIKGEVIPKAAQPTESYPIKMGSLSLKSKGLNFGNVMNDTILIKTIDYANLSKDTITLSCSSKDAYLYASASMEKPELVILPGQKGSLHVRLDAPASMIYGPLHSSIYLVINGKEVRTDDMSLSITANIQENFSHMTEDQLKKAPFAEISKEINLGTFAANKKATATFHMANAGINTLLIRRMIADQHKLSVTASKSIRSGKKGVIKVNILPMEAGNYTSEITIITNDPKKPVQVVKLNWTIEK